MYVVTPFPNILSAFPLKNGGQRSGNMSRSQPHRAGRGVLRHRQARLPREDPLQDARRSRGLRGPGDGEGGTSCYSTLNSKLIFTS